METRLEQNVQEEFTDDFLLTKDDIAIYDTDATFDNIIQKLRELKIARNKFTNGYHLRLTPDYRPRIEAFTGKVSDPVGDAVEYNLDSEDEYNRFNMKLNELYLLMSKPEIAYINDCLLCGRPEISVREKFDLGRDLFTRVKLSAQVRLAIAFNIAVYK